MSDDDGVDQITSTVRGLAELEASVPWAAGGVDLANGPGWVQLVAALHDDLAALTAATA